MVIAITPGETWEWVHESDLEKKKEDQTVFLCRVPTYRQNTWIQDKYSGGKVTQQKKGYRQQKHEDGVGIQFNVGAFQRALILTGLLDVKGLKDLKGNLVEFETRHTTIEGESLDVPTDSFLGRLRPSLLVELANEIGDHQDLGESDRKN